MKEAGQAVELLAPVGSQGPFIRRLTGRQLEANCRDPPPPQNGGLRMTGRAAGIGAAFVGVGLAQARPSYAH